MKNSSNNNNASNNNNNASSSKLSSSQCSDHDTPLSLEEIRAVFEELDADHNERLSFAEVQAALDKMGIRTSQRELADLFIMLSQHHQDELDTRATQTRITPDTSTSSSPVQPSIFPHSAHSNSREQSILSNANTNADSLLSSSSSQDDVSISFDQFVWFVAKRESLLREIFQDLDLDGSGKLDSREVAKALRTIGLESSTDEVRAMIRRYDTNNDGKIDYREFRRLTLLFPSIEVIRIFDQWRSGVIDIGETSYVVPETDDCTVDAPSDRIAWKRILVCGGVAGATSRTLTAPFDRLKVVLQAGVPVSGKIPNGILDGLKLIYKEGGFRAFFRGNGTNILKITPETAVRWFAFENAMSFINQHNANAGRLDDNKPAEVTIYQRFLAGAFAGTCSQTAIYPLEVAKTRLAVSPPNTYRGIVHCLMQTAKYEGFRGLFQGLTPSLCGIIPYAGVDMSVYFTLKAAWLRRHPEENPGTLTILGMGAGSSICGQVIAFPLQLVRTKLQTQGSKGYEGPRYAGMVDCFRQVFRTNGIFGLYRGWSSNCMKAIPAIAISYAVYEHTKRLLNVT